MEERVLLFRGWNCKFGIFRGQKKNSRNFYWKKTFLLISWQRFGLRYPVFDGLFFHPGVGSSGTLTQLLFMTKHSINKVHGTIIIISVFFLKKFMFLTLLWKQFMFLAAPLETVFEWQTVNTQNMKDPIWKENLKKRPAAKKYHVQQIIYWHKISRWEYLPSYSQKKKYALKIVLNCEWCRTVCRSLHTKLAIYEASHHISDVIHLSFSNRFDKSSTSQNWFDRLRTNKSYGMIYLF